MDFPSVCPIYPLSRLDFFFGQRNHAIHFASFLQSVVPTRQQFSQQIISADVRAGTATFKCRRVVVFFRYTAVTHVLHSLSSTVDTYSVEIVPVCKDDLVVLPLKLAKQLGNINPLVLCTRVSGGGLTVLDVRTLQQQDVQTAVFWRSPFSSLCEAGAGGVGGGLSDYYVLDVEPITQSSQGRVSSFGVAFCDS